ncbi:GNAT family N-acetyltransferase [Paenibacillus sp. GSMTC-2017]|uniref:GNAT family N-acetyltransferase n=1 Tax=Paenibacillus sp. GSMTC-2017 TaxID=2794350 RepID=UPI0018D5DB88|nr:GNAT family N-acetyltransferase [Paenibacillus sp. GSMTC-2017]MBH5320490.1 GNAT family N-acetyltransferase [Paenibacillus sp. GSMTC-2017]
MPENLRIERIGLDRFTESVELSQFAFQFKRSPEEIEELKVNFQIIPADRFAVIIDNQIAAQATVLELHTNIAGKSFAMGGVAGVATWPEYRRQGLVGKLLVHALQEMKEKGQTLSFLHPFAFGFYRKFGWETYIEYKQYELTTSQLPLRTNSPGKIERKSGYSELKQVYDQFAERYNGTLVRSNIWWERRVWQNKQGQVVLYSDNTGKAQGYLIYQVKEKELKIHELVHLNEESRSALWTFISQHDSMIDKVSLDAPIDDRLADFLQEPRIKQEIIPYFMARIVDLEAFINLYPFQKSAESDHFYLEVKDEYAPWNAGTYELTINSSGKGHLSRVNEVEDGKPIIRAGIGALASLFIGYRTASELSYSNGISAQIDTINRLHSRIPERTTYLADFF